MNKLSTLAVLLAVAMTFGPSEMVYANAGCLSIAKVKNLKLPAVVAPRVNGPTNSVELAPSDSPTFTNDSSPNVSSAATGSYYQIGQVEISNGCNQDVTFNLAVTATPSNGSTFTAIVNNSFTIAANALDQVFDIGGRLDVEQSNTKGDLTIDADVIAQSTTNPVGTLATLANSFQIEAHISKPIQLVVNKAIILPPIVKPRNNNDTNTLTLSPGGSISYTGDSSPNGDDTVTHTVGGLTGGYQLGQFTVSGEENYMYDVELGSASCNVQGVSFTPEIAALPSGASYWQLAQAANSHNVGGTLSVSGNAQDGAFTCTFSVTTLYQNNLK